MMSLSRPTWHSHLRAVWAITLKDWRHFWRYPLNAVAWVLQPLVFLTPVYFMGRVFSVGGEARGFAGFTGTTDYMSYILIGTILNNFIQAVFWRMGFGLKEEMDGGVLEANWLAPLPRPLMMVGRTVSGLFTTAVTSACMLLVAALLFGFRLSGSVWAAFLTALPMLLGLYGFGFAFAALVLVLREANVLTDVSSFLIQLLSGAMFPVTALPRWLLPIALFLPLTYGLDAVRAWLLNTPTLLPLPLEIALLIISMVLLIALGLAAFRVLERRVRRLGTLGQH